VTMQKLHIHCGCWQL